jgi:hypothetical protein
MAPKISLVLMPPIADGNCAGNPCNAALRSLASYGYADRPR